MRDRFDRLLKDIGGSDFDSLVLLLALERRLMCLRWRRAERLLNSKK